MKSAIRHSSKKYISSVTFLLVYCLQLLTSVTAVELTFELPDNAKECFYEEIDVGSEFTIEFQVCFQTSS